MNIPNSLATRRTLVPVALCEIVISENPMGIPFASLVIEGEVIANRLALSEKVAVDRIRRLARKHVSGDTSTIRMTIV